MYASKPILGGAPAGGAGGDWTPETTDVAEAA